MNIRVRKILPFLDPSPPVSATFDVSQLKISSCVRICDLLDQPLQPTWMSFKDAPQICPTVNNEKNHRILPYCPPFNENIALRNLIVSSSHNYVQLIPTIR